MKFPQQAYAHVLKAAQMRAFGVNSNHFGRCFRRVHTLVLRLFDERDGQRNGTWRYLCRGACNRTAKMEASPFFRRWAGHWLTPTWAPPCRARFKRLTKIAGSCGHVPSAQGTDSLGRSVLTLIYLSALLANDWC